MFIKTGPGNYVNADRVIHVTVDETQATLTIDNGFTFSIDAKDVEASKELEKLLGPHAKPK